MTDDLVTQIDRLVAILAEVQKPVADLLSSVETTLYSLRQARFALRPSESPALAERRHKETRANGTAQPLPPIGKRPGRILAIYDSTEDPLTNTEILGALAAAGDPCPLTVVNTVLSNLAQRGYLTRVGLARYQRKKQPAEPTNPS